MKLEMNQWYRFKTDTDKREWLKMIQSQYLHYLDIGKHMQYECMRVRRSITGTISINFRSTYSEHFMPYVKTWTGYTDTDTATKCTSSGSGGLHVPVTGIKADTLIVDDLCNQPRSTGKLNELLKGDKTNMSNIILKTREAAIADLKEQYVARREQLIAETESAKIIIAATEALNKQKDINVKWKDLLQPYMLLDSDVEKLQELDDELIAETGKIIDKFDELQSLFSLADNFEQKQSLLRAYGCIKFGGIANVTQ